MGQIIWDVGDNGADINKAVDTNYKGEKRRFTPLMLALTQCKCERESLVKKLLDNGADVNIKDKNDGNTALLLCIAEYDFCTSQIIKNMISAGANVKIKNNYNQSPLALAKRVQDMKEAYKKEYSDIIKLLKDAGAQE